MESVFALHKKRQSLFFKNKKLVRPANHLDQIYPVYVRAWIHKGIYLPLLSVWVLPKVIGIEYEN